MNLWREVWVVQVAHHEEPELLIVVYLLVIEPYVGVSLDFYDIFANYCIDARVEKLSQALYKDCGALGQGYL